MFGFGPTWEEALYLCMFDGNFVEAVLACFACGKRPCMFDKNVLEAMLACFRMFRFGPTWEEAVCMFDKNVLEAMLACFSRSCIHCIHVLYYPGQVLFSSFMVVEPVAVGQAWLSSEFVVVSVSFSMLLI